MTKEEACAFSLMIFLSKADNFWYLSVLDSTDSRCTGGKIGHHHGHARVSPDLIIPKSTRMAPDNLELVGHCEQSGMSCAATAKLLTDRYNDRITAAQVHYLLQKKLTHKASSADEMIADFEKRYDLGYCTLSSSHIVFRNMLCNRGDVSWILVTHSKDAGLVIVNKPSGRPKKERAVSQSELLNGSEADTHEIMSELKLSTCKDTRLLIFFWLTDEELRLVQMFPECFAFDVTSQTNKEKRDLFTGTGKTGDNKCFTACRAFMPSQKRWVFALIWKVCVPMMWGPTVTEQVRLILTDGDADEYIPLLESIHKVSQSLRSRDQNLHMPGQNLSKCHTQSLHLSSFHSRMEEKGQCEERGESRRC